MLEFCVLGNLNKPIWFLEIMWSSQFRLHIGSLLSYLPPWSQINNFNIKINQSKNTPVSFLFILKKKLGLLPVCYSLTEMIYLCASWWKPFASIKSATLVGFLPRDCIGMDRKFRRKYRLALQTKNSKKHTKAPLATLIKNVARLDQCWKKATVILLPKSSCPPPPAPTRF